MPGFKQYRGHIPLGRAYVDDAVGVVDDATFLLTDGREHLSGQGFTVDEHGLPVVFRCCS